MPHPASELPVGRYIGLVREQAGLTQAQLAAKVGVSPPSISRIESCEKAVNPQETAAILKAVGTPLARQLGEYLGQEWDCLDRPPFDHPDRGVLWQANLTLRKLEDLRRSPGLKDVYLRKVDLFEAEARRLADYLASREHQIAFIGTIGVGKSTAICKLAGLLKTGESKLGKECVLPTGGGSTTLCELQIVHGPNYGVRIEPRGEDSVRQDVEEFADHLLRQVRPDTRVARPGGEQDERQGVAKEVERAIRNMAGLVKKPKSTVDPAGELAAQHPTPTDLVIQILSRMGLQRRTRRDAWYSDECGTPPMQWLQQINADINNGSHPEFGLASRIELIVPEPVLGSKSLPLTLTDTKGVHHTAERPDLECHLDDPRTLVVLCSHFNDAPNIASQNLLRRAREMGVRDAEDRTAVLVLPRPDEATAVNLDGGGQVEDEREGYEVKRDAIRLQLGGMGYDAVPVEFFNAREEDPRQVREFLVSRLTRYRGRYAEQAGHVAEAVDELIQNQEKEQVRLVFEQVERQLWAWINKNREVDWDGIPVQQSLVQAIAKTHPSSINVTVKCQGEYGELDYYHHLGVGARQIAVMLIGEKKVRRFKVIVQNQIDSEEFAPARPFLGRLLEALDAAVEAAYRNVQLAGREAFKGELKGDRTYWEKCRSRYGKGKGYRDDIREWTDEQVESGYDDAHKLLQGVVADEWAKIVTRMERLLKEKEERPVGAAGKA